MFQWIAMSDDPSSLVELGPYDWPESPIGVPIPRMYDANEVKSVQELKDLELIWAAYVADGQGFSQEDVFEDF